ncbi:hypothetical protein POM88_053993 [Heracleum sosnowskyi]|uniref:Uncharacterized protein n=1 Tax=Heracleum sosnowskyi TaxID=360622 RepID=A0AAD8GMX6_9APIA|nr:hypothetical protein POM88_053993 [Heracleum sosnowskyi]
MFKTVDSFFLSIIHTVIHTCYRLLHHGYTIDSRLRELFKGKDRDVNGLKLSERFVEKQLKRNGDSNDNEISAITSVSSRPLPAFGTVLGDQEEYSLLGKYIVAPYDCRYRWWQIFLAVMVIHSAWSSPFGLGFKKASTGVLLYIDMVVAVFFAIKIILIFFVA